MHIYIYIYEDAIRTGPGRISSHCDVICTGASPGRISSHCDVICTGPGTGASPRRISSHCDVICTGPCTTAQWRESGRHSSYFNRGSCQGWAVVSSGEFDPIWSRSQWYGGIDSDHNTGKTTSALHKAVELLRYTVYHSSCLHRPQPISHTWLKIQSAWACICLRSAASCQTLPPAGVLQG